MRMIDVIFYQHSKTVNSTKRPSGDGVTFSCELKDPTSIDNPEIRLAIGTSSNPEANNYCYIKDFGRYYFVDRWVWDGGVWTAVLSTDPMTTFRNDIGSSTQYVLRSSAQNDDNIIDSMFPTSAGYVKTAVTYPSQGTAAGYKPYVRFMREYYQGIYVIGVLNDGDLDLYDKTEDGVSIGGSLTYYAFTHNNFKTFLKRLFADVTWLDINLSEISENLQKVLAQPFEYIKSCMWFPLNWEQITADDWPYVLSLKFGFWKIDTYIGTLLGQGTYNMVADLEIPKHPQAESEFSYFNLAPFTKYTLCIQPFGEIVLDNLQFYGVNSVQLRFHIDFISGIGKMLVVKPGSPDVTLLSARAMIGVPVQIGSVMRDLVGQASGVLSAVNKALNLDFGGVFDGIMSTNQAGYGSGSTFGAQGSIVEYRDSPYLLAEFLEQVEIDIDHSGRPLCQNKRINTVRGYIQCKNPKIEISGTPNEIKTIESYMASGFYYE